MFCSHCGTRLAEDVDICCKCGLPSKAQINASFRNEASALKWFVPIGRSVWAVMSGYLGLLSIIPGVGLLAVICGCLGLEAIAKNPQKSGKGRSWFGIVSGAIFTILHLYLFLK